MKNWFSIKARQSADKNAVVTTEISIHDAIGAWNISAKSFLEQLRNVSSKEIVLSINSPGGSVIDGIAMYNGLREHAKKTNATITVKVLGIAASIASVVAMAGDKIVMPKNALMMVHNPSGGMYGNAAELRDMADLLDKFESSLIQTYVARTGKTADEIKALLDKETFMTADEAVKLGFADEVSAALNVTASFDLDNLPENVVALFNSSADKSETEGKSLASEIVSLAETMGLKDYVENWLLDTAIQNKEQAQAAMLVAREIQELCDYAKMPTLTASLIANKSTLDGARAELFKAKTEAQDKTNVDNKLPTQIVPPSNESQAAINHAEIYAARQPKKKGK